MEIFKGAGVAIITPMKDNYEVNYDKLDEILEEQIAGGTDAVVICGTTGESATLSEAEHMEAIRFTIERVNHRIPVVAGTGSNCTATAVQMSKEADEAGADGILLVTPYYNKGTQNGLIAHFSKIAGEVIATPGCESNVKEIFDKTWELKQRPNVMIFNQFEEMGNPLWHYNVTGYALADLFEAVKRPGDNFAGAAFTSGSAGTMSAGDLLKERYPHLKLAVGEALQCPTILNNGFGGHRIEGIGDKHIPWIHNVKNTDMAIAIDDEDSQRLLRLFNTEEGHQYLREELKLDEDLIEKLSWLGISGIANVLCCIKMAKYYEFTEKDVVGTVLTDSAAMYQSRITELNEMHGAYNVHEAALDHNLHILGLKTDNLLELTYTERKRVHNLKYYTWVEQQARDVKDLNDLWYDTANTWDAVHAQAAELDELINEFNEATGLLKTL